MFNAEQLRRDARRIWDAGVGAVRADRLMQNALSVKDDVLRVGENLEFSLPSIGRIAVVGGGKAGAAMAAGLESQLPSELLGKVELTGLLSVPENCVRSLPRIELVGGRPAGRNEPTTAGVAASRRMLELVRSLDANDLCLCLLSGGGSALLPAPVEGVSLETKLYVTRELSARGANIEQLNTVRKHLSEIKGGRLAAACPTENLITLVISDVLGDPLDTIASGPTYRDSTTAGDALEVLREFSLFDDPNLPGVVPHLERASRSSVPAAEIPGHHLILANNATAVDAAGIEAEKLGYSHAMTSASHSEGAAEDVGRHLAEMALSMRSQPGPNCLISGGEPVVELAAAAKRGLGGRNQQLILAALEALGDCAGVVLLSGGTDGEDGPTDAAGAYIDSDVVARARSLDLKVSDYLSRNDAYHFFERIDALIKTGPTETNVCDLRVLLVDRSD